jgi:anti-sigma B factor antagonist
MKFFASPLERFRRSPKNGDGSSDRIGVVSIQHESVKSESSVVKVSQQNDRLVVAVGEIAMQDLSEVRDFGARLIELLESESPKVLVVDLGKIRHLSSESLNQLISVNCHARGRGTQLVLANLCGPLMDVFQITRLDRLFDVAENA